MFEGGRRVMSESIDGGSGQQVRVTVDQLIALNDEILALTRSGVPLERGLLDLGADVPGRLSQIATALGERMSRGESLSAALAAAGPSIPRVYRAVVEAGIRSGRLSVALEGLSAYARGYAEARRSIGLALWYPLAVFLLAYGLFLFIVTVIMPRFIGAFNALGVKLDVSLVWLGAIGEYAWYWAPWVPIGLLIFIVGWVGSRRASRIGGAGSFGLLRWFPWIGAMMKGYEAASFADLLALLVEHRVAYPEALTLAGEASGDPALAESSRALAAAVQKGLPPAEALQGSSAFPPLLRWLLATGSQQSDHVAALRQMAERYRGLARFQAEKIRLFLPTILLFGVGGTATFLYAMTLFIPLTSLWHGLAEPIR